MRANHAFGKDLLSADDASSLDFEDVMDRARAHAGHNGDPEGRVGRGGRVIAMMFDQRSTRTRLGFQVASAKLGHHVIDVQDSERCRIGKEHGESLSDHVRTISEYADLLVVRSGQEGVPGEVAAISHRPVINAGNGAGEHPSQAFVDVFSILMQRGDPRALTIALSCDTRARFAVSFVKLLRHRVPRALTLCVDPTAAIDPRMQEAVDEISARGARVGFVHDVRDTLDHDVLSIQMQDMSRFAGAKVGDAEFRKEPEADAFTITAAKIRAARSGTLILNPLPRFAELDPSCDDLPNAGYFEQVRLSTFVRMGLLERMLAGVPWSGRTATSAVWSSGWVAPSSPTAPSPSPFAN